MVEPKPPALPHHFGKYQVESLIAEGGMAEVFLASTAPPVVRRVAVKRIKPAFAAEQGFLDMFQDEARVAACFDHPNIVRVIDFEAGPPPYLVMEHLDGPDLRRLLWEAAIKKQWIPLDLVAAIIAAAARGLHYAHTWRDPSGRHLQVIHRDMSPQNIMLTKAGGVRVVDFGIAKAAGRNTKTRAGIIKGKYAYMAPEQVRGQPLTPRTDLFGLGIIFYEALAYKNPFRRERDELSIIAVCDEDPPAIQTLRADAPPSFDAILKQVLSKDPDDRFENAAAFADAIDDAIAERRQPVRAEHLADFLSGLAAMPMPESSEEKAPEAEPDHEVSEADVRAASKIMPAVKLPPSAQQAAVASEQAADEPEPGLSPGLAPSSPKPAAEADAGDPALLDASTRLQPALDLEPLQALDQAREGQESQDAVAEAATLLQPALSPKQLADIDEVLAKKRADEQARIAHENSAASPAVAAEAAGLASSPAFPASRVQASDSIRGSFPQAMPPDWKGPLFIVLGLALVGGLVGAALAWLAS